MVLAAPPADARRRGRRPHHPGRARPGLPGHPRHDGRRPSPTPSRRPSRRQLARRRTPRRSSTAALRDHGRIVLAPTLDAAIAFVNAYAPGAPLGRRRAARADGRRASATPARSSSAPGRPSPPATTRPAPTTSCRPAGSPARRGAPVRRGVRQVRPGPADRPRRAWPRSARPSRRWPRPRGCSPTATPSRSASRSPTR